MRVAVIGCGLVGAAVARELQLRGAQVVVYEASGPGRGTSETTFAWVNSHDKQPRAYHGLNVAGIHAHVELHAQTAPGAQWFFPTGNLVWAAGTEDEARLSSLRRRLESWDYPVRALTARAARELEPDVLIPESADEVLFCPLEGYVLPALLLGRLLGEALDRGAELRCPARVETVTSEPSGLRIGLAGRSEETADIVVSCAGRWSDDVMAAAGYTLPMVDHEARGSAAVGYLAYTQPMAVRLRRVLTTPRLNVRPDGGGRLVLQGLDLDGSADPALPVEADGSIATEFLSRLHGILRGGERAELEAIRVGQRAIPADGLTVAGRIDDQGRVYVIATHSGVTLAPLLARLAADEIVGDTDEELLAPFRPQRLVLPRRAG